VKNRRRINRGQRKADVELSLQMVEDIIDARIVEATEADHAAMGVLVAKVLFHQEQLRCIAATLNAFGPEIEDRNYNSRELIASLVNSLEPIFAHVIPVHTPEEYAELSIDDIREDLSQHCGAYWDEESYPYEGEDRVEVGDTDAIVRRGIDLLPDRPVRRRTSVDEEDEDIDDDDILSAVSDEVNEDIGRPRRRRR
jgi:hypothetical protein